MKMEVGKKYYRVTDGLEVECVYIALKSNPGRLHVLRRLDNGCEFVGYPAKGVWESVDKPRVGKFYKPVSNSNISKCTGTTPMGGVILQTKEGYEWVLPKANFYLYEEAKEGF